MGYSFRCLLLGLWSGACACAVLASDTLRGDSLDLYEVSLRALQQRRVPFVQSVLHRKGINARYTAQDLPFMLSQAVPSVVAYSDAGTGVGQTGFRIRGTDPDRTFVSINGVPFNDAESQGIFIGNVADILSSAEEVRVTRGAGMDMGPGASLGSSIQIRTYATQSVPTYATWESHYGSYNTMRHTLRAGIRLVPHTLQLTFRLSQLHSDGYVERAAANYYAGYVGLDYTHKRHHFHWIYFDAYTRNQQAWGGVAQHVFLKDPYRRPINTIGWLKDHSFYAARDYYRQSNMQFIYESQWTPALQVRNTSFWVRGAGFYDAVLEDQPLPHWMSLRKGDAILEKWLENTLVGNRLHIEYKSNAAHTFRYNLSVQGYKGAHLGWMHGIRQTAFPKTLAYGIFPAYHWVWSQGLQWVYTFRPAWALYTGVQLRWVHYRISGAEEDPGLRWQHRFFFANPGIGLTYTKGVHRWSFSYALGSREPARKMIVAHPGILAMERLHDFEINYHYFRRKLSLEQTAYAMWYGGELVLSGAIDAVGGFVRQRIEKSLRSGLETQLRYQILRSLTWQSTFTFSINRVRYALFTFGKTLPFSPNYTGHAMLDYSFGQTFHVQWRLQWVGRQFLDAQQQASLSLHPYALQSVQLSWERPPNPSLYDVYGVLAVDNVFNQRYAPNGYVYAGQAYVYPATGRTYRVGLRVRFRAKEEKNKK